MLYSNPIATGLLAISATVAAIQVFNIAPVKMQLVQGAMFNRTGLMVFSLYNITSGTILAFFYQDSRALISVDMELVKNRRGSKPQRISTAALDS